MAIPNGSPCPSDLVLGLFPSAFVENGPNCALVVDAPLQEGYQTREGYLLLADISGYTAFLTGTELSHSQAIVHELTTLLRERLAPPMRFVKVEGDAVFCYADRDQFGDPERFVELIEVCYFDFANRLFNMARSTTCPCAACAAIGSLDLKFLAHRGSFVIQREPGGDDLAGPDVIQVHRLLKNTISDGDGPKAYAFFTDACLEGVPWVQELSRHGEPDETFGEITGWVYDLTPVLAAMREAHREYVTSEEADLESSVEVPVPPVVAWKYWVEPRERQRWACRQFSKDPDRVTKNARGRVGEGAKTHCNHAPGTWTWEYTDWRPFDYFSAHTSSAPVLGRLFGQRPQLQTVEFLATEAGGTRIVHRSRLTNRGPISLLTYRLQRRLLAAFWRQANAALVNIATEDASAKIDR